MTRYNILILMLDQLNGMLFPGGPANWHNTPNLDRLAAKSTRFAKTYSASLLCASVRALFMLGQLPSRTGIYENAAEFGRTPDYRRPDERIDWRYHDRGSVTGSSLAEITNQMECDGADVARLRQAFFANISCLDDKIGGILDVLEHFRAMAAARWSLESFDAEVGKSQTRRWGAYKALRNGFYHPWDFEPHRDASKRHMRNQ